MLSTPFSSFFLYVSDLPFPVSCELVESFSNYRDFSHTNSVSSGFFSPLKLGKYSFETKFHFQLALRKVSISAWFLIDIQNTLLTTKPKEHGYSKQVNSPISVTYWQSMELLEKAFTIFQAK